MSNITETNTTFLSYLTEKRILSEPPRSSDGRILSELTIQERIVDANKVIQEHNDNLSKLGPYTSKNSEEHYDLLNAIYWSTEYLNTLTSDADSDSLRVWNIRHNSQPTPSIISPSDDPSLHPLP